MLTLVSRPVDITKLFKQAKNQYCQNGFVYSFSKVSNLDQGPKGA